MPQDSWELYIAILVTLILVLVLVGWFRGRA